MSQERFTDSDATRVFQAFEARLSRKLKNGSRTQTTWGTVGSIDSFGKTASAYLYGETDGAYMSEGFRVPEAMYLTVGDVVKVSMNYDSDERWVEEVVFPSTNYKKLAFDLATGSILIGDGTTAPQPADLSILATITAYIETLLDDPDAATARATLGLGSLATLSSLAHSATTGITATDHHAAPAAGPDADTTIDAAGAAGTASTFARSGHGHRVNSTAGPGGDITVDAAGAAGSTGALARAAHGHRVNTSTATPPNASRAGSSGTSGTVQRASHRHASDAPVVRVYTSGATWTKPTDLNYIIVEVVGGGGGGGGAGSTGATTAGVGGGGGGGGYARKVFSTEALPSSCTVAVGGAGSAGAAGANSGGTGGTSSFSGTGITTVSATGGAGGGPGTATSANANTSGGAGGVGSGGDINNTGEDGFNAWASNAGDVTSQGHGGSSVLGGGARASAANNSGAGIGGGAYGGGGSGGHNRINQAAVAGGAGAAGVVIVTEIYF